MSNFTTCAVIVTYNRKNLLLECLEALRKQTKPLDGIYLIDNASTDGTPEILLENDYIKELPHENLRKPLEKEFEISNLTDGNPIKFHYVRMHENTGGSGGFYEGIKRAYEKGYEWIWVSDDDALPDENAFLNFEKAKELLEKEGELQNTAAICGSVINNGKYDLGHRRRIKKGFLLIKEISVQREEYVKQYFEIDLSSYVGTILNSKFLKKAGFTRKDFFIDRDDYEHSLRLRKYGKIFCFPNIKVFHNTLLSGSNSISWRNFYSIRNKLLMVKWHFPRRYFIFLTLYTKYRGLVAKFVKRDYKHKVYYEMICKAIECVKNEKLGKDEMYKPGWKI